MFLTFFLPRSYCNIPSVSDDAEVQRQKVVPVLISDGRKRSRAPRTQLSPSIGSFGLTVTPTHPSVRPLIHPSEPFSTGTPGIFFPSTMLNTVLTSVLGWNWGVDRGEGQTSEGANKWCLYFFLFFFLMFSSLRFISVQPLLRGSRLVHAPGDFFILICQKKKKRSPFTVVSAPEGPVEGAGIQKPTNMAEKRQFLKKKQTTKKILKV